MEEELLGIKRTLKPVQEEKAKNKAI